MSDAFQELQAMRRKGISIREYWQFILQSSSHREALFQEDSQGLLDFKMWSFLLSSDHERYVIHWEKNHPELKFTGSWFNVVHYYVLEFRQKAFKFFLELEVESEAKIPFLLEFLKDVSWRIRLIAVKELGNINATKAISALLPFLSAQEIAIREETIEALRKLKAKEAFYPLLWLFQDEAMGVRQRAVKAIGQIGVDAEEKIIFLAKFLKENTYWFARVAAAEALGELGESATLAIPILIMTTQDSFQNVREKAVVALGKIGIFSKEVCAALEQTVQDESELVRKQALKILNQIEENNFKEMK